MKKIFTLALAAVAALSVSAADLTPGYLAGEIGLIDKSAGDDPSTWVLQEGTANGWVPETPIEIPQVEQDVYEGEFYVTGYFAFSTTPGTATDENNWATFNANRWVASDGDQTVTIGEPKLITLFTVDQNAAFSIGVARPVKISINLEYGELVITDLSGAEIVAPDPAITGSAWGWGYDQAFANNNGVWEINFAEPVALTTADAIKICGADPDAQWGLTNFGAADATALIELDKEYDLVAGGSDVKPAAEMTIKAARLVIADDWKSAKLTLLSEPAAISDIVVDSNEAVEYYNLQGVKVSADELPAGLYIAKQGAKTSKVLVK